ncbi:MAG: IS21 family transposase [Deltaproteobacteria bacterium]|nr:IS21 family transposase [Deltaproteobacteria bacterium]
MKVLDQETRRLILRLAEKGVAERRIARLTGHSRPAIRRVLKEQVETPRSAGRSSVLDERRVEIQRLVGVCRGNLVRVHEELTAAGVGVAYTTLTDFVRKHNLKRPPTLPAGRYHFEPGQEMQFDTSPHPVLFQDGQRKCQCASLVLCYSRMWYFQYYHRFTRLECKTFLTQAIQYFQGAAARCMVDNTNLAVLHGTGPGATMVPEMVDFGRRFGFVFVAHEVGDANRSARVERRFHYAQNNFLAGRTFADLDDLNGQAQLFCDRVNRSENRHLKSAPLELFAAERSALSPLPPVVPEVYQVSFRTVDVEGFVHVGGNIYSVPYELIGRSVEIRESLRQLRVYSGPHEVAAHLRVSNDKGRRVTDKRHRPQRSGQGKRSRQALPQELTMRAAHPLLAQYLDKIRAKAPGRGANAVCRLNRMYCEYPLDLFLAAVHEADKYAMTDLARLEEMVLRSLAGRLFPYQPVTETEE